MNIKTLVLVVVVAAVASAVLVACSAQALDSSQTEVEVESESFVQPEPLREMKGPRPQRGQDMPPAGSDESLLVPPEISGLDVRMTDDSRGLVPLYKPNASPMPEKPRYEHDAEPQVLEANLDVMIEGDIRNFDPGFVADAIDFAENNGMHEVAERLKAKLASLIESYMRSSSNINSANSRASGFDDDAVDEDADIIFVEEEEETEEDTVSFDEPLPMFYNSFSAPAVQNILILSL